MHRSDEKDVVLESIFAVRTAKTDLPTFSVIEHVHSCSSARSSRGILKQSKSSRVAIPLNDASEPLDAAPAVEGTETVASSQISTGSSLRTLDGTKECDGRVQPVGPDDRRVRRDVDVLGGEKTRERLTLSCPVPLTVDD